MFAPVLMVLLGAIEARQRIRKAVFLALACAATTALVFWPVWARYGPGFFTFYEKHGRPDWWTILHRGTVEVWGTLGVIGVLVAVVGAVLWRIKREQPSTSPRQQPGNRLVIPALLVTVAIYLAAYLRLPDQAGYLLPVIPATILLAGFYLPRLCFRILCLGLLAAPFVDPWAPKQWAGPIFMDRQERIQTMENIRNFVQFSRTLPDKSVILVGGWEPQIDVLFPEAASGRIVYVYLLSEEQLKATLEGGFTVYYLPAIRAFNASVYGIDVATFGARDLRAIYEERVRVQPRPK
jgi:hypothetical protein